MFDPNASADLSALDRDVEAQLAALGFNSKDTDDAAALLDAADDLEAQIADLSDEEADELLAGGLSDDEELKQLVQGEGKKKRRSPPTSSASSTSPPGPPATTTTSQEEVQQPVEAVVYRTAEEEAEHAAALADLLGNDEDYGPFSFEEVELCTSVEWMESHDVLEWWSAELQEKRRGLLGKIDTIVLEKKQVSAQKQGPSKTSSPSFAPSGRTTDQTAGGGKNTTKEHQNNLLRSNQNKTSSPTTTTTGTPRTTPNAASVKEQLAKEEKELRQQVEDLEFEIDGVKMKLNSLQADIQCGNITKGDYEQKVRERMERDRKLGEWFVSHERPTDAKHCLRRCEVAKAEFVAAEPVDERTRVLLLREMDMRVLAYKQGAQRWVSFLHAWRQSKWALTHAKTLSAHAKTLEGLRDEIEDDTAVISRRYLQSLQSRMPPTFNRAVLMGLPETERQKQLQELRERFVKQEETLRELSREALASANSCAAAASGTATSSSSTSQTNSAGVGSESAGKTSKTSNAKPAKKAAGASSGGGAAQGASSATAGDTDGTAAAVPPATAAQMRELAEERKRQAVALHQNRKGSAAAVSWCDTALKDPEQMLPLVTEGEVLFMREVVHEEIGPDQLEIKLSHDGKSRPWWDWENAYFKLDFGLGKEDTAGRTIPMGGKTNDWTACFPFPDFGHRNTKSLTMLQHKIKRARFSFEIWRPRTMAFMMGHRPIGHCTRGLKLSGLLTDVETEEGCVVSAEADDRQASMNFKVRFRVRTPLQQPKTVTQRIEYSSIDAYPPSLAAFPAQLNIPVPVRPLPEERTVVPESPSITNTKVEPAPTAAPGGASSSSSSRIEQEVSTSPVESGIGEDQHQGTQLQNSSVGGENRNPTDHDEILQHQPTTTTTEATSSSQPPVELPTYPLPPLSAEEFDTLAASRPGFSHEWCNTVEGLGHLITHLETVTRPGQGDSNSNPTVAAMKSKTLGEARSKKARLEEAIGGGEIDFDAYVAQVRQDSQMDARLALFYRTKGSMDDCRLAYGRHKVLKESLESLPSPEDEATGEATEEPAATNASSQGAAPLTTGEGAATTGGGVV